MLGGVTGGVIPPGEIMRRRLWLSASAVAVAAALVAAVPLLAVVAIRDPDLLALGLPLLAAAVGQAGGRARGGGRAAWHGRPAPRRPPVRRDGTRPGRRRPGQRLPTGH